MGFTLTQNCNFSATSKLRSPEKEAADKAKHERFKTMPRPKFSGTEKQLYAANKSLETFLFYAFHWAFDPDEIEAFLQTYKGKSVQFWIANKPKAGGSGETRIAVERELEAIKADRAALAKSQAAIARLSKQQINKMIGRGV